MTEKYPVTVDAYGAWWLKGRVHHVWIERRPAYCDRGHFIAYVEPAPGAGFEFAIDAADGWPRFYMDYDRMVAEIKDWLDWREGDGPESAARAVYGTAGTDEP